MTGYEKCDNLNIKNIGGIIMAKIPIEKHYISRLEDVIRIANEGKRVDMEVELKKLPMIQEIPDNKAEGKPHKINTYLLIAYYNFKVDVQSYKFSKVYAFANAEESLIVTEMNKDIANARLVMDYKRLSDAHIHFHEKFF